MNPLCNILQYTPQQYYQLFEDLYVDWCEMQQISPMHLQQMLMDQRLINWFEREYRSRESMFVQAIAGRPSMSMNALRDLYDDLTTTIFVYPKPIMQDIKRRARRISPSANDNATKHFNN